MTRAPRNPREPLVPRSFAGLILWQGILLSAVTLGAFQIGMLRHGIEGDGLRRAVTIAFMTLALTQVFHAFNVRSRTRSAISGGLFTNRWLWAAVGLCILLQLAAVYAPVLQRALQTLPPTGPDWLLICAAAVIPVAVIELVKAAVRFGR